MMSQSRMLRGMVWSLVGVFLVLVYALYHAPLGHPITVGLAHALPFPAARVGRSTITIRKLVVRKETLPDATFDELLQTMISERLVSALRRRYDIAFPRDELRRIAEEQAGAETAFGWSARRYKKELLQPFVEARAVEEAIWDHEEIQKSKRDRIEAAKMELDRGVVFDAVVLSYSEDFSSVKNGDLGSWAITDVPEAWVVAAATLPVGEVSVVLEDDRRFVLLRVDGREEVNEVKGVKEVDVAETARVKLSGIIVQKKSLADVLAEQAEHTPPRVFIKTH